MRKIYCEVFRFLNNFHTVLGSIQSGQDGVNIIQVFQFFSDGEFRINIYGSIRSKNNRDYDQTNCNCHHAGKNR